MYTGMFPVPAINIYFELLQIYRCFIRLNIQLNQNFNFNRS